MKKIFLSGVVILACICIIISVAYACSTGLDIDSDYIEYAPVGSPAYVDAWVVANGPVYYEGWRYIWPSGFYDHGQWDHVNGYESHSWAKCDTPGWYYYVTVIANGPNGSDSADTNVRIFKMNLDISSVSDENEENPGGYICVNDDDDNNNGTPDKEETGTVSGEDDLVPISLSYEPSNLYPGYIELVMPYSSSMKVWSSSQKGTLVIDKYNRTQRWYYNQVPSTLYVEGCLTGTLQELYLQYTPDGQNYPGYPYNHDTVKFNIVNFSEVVVDKVVKYYTTDEGPLYPGCPGSYVSLYAVPDPPGPPCPYPVGEPHWTLQKPAESNATLEVYSGSSVTTLYPDKLGEYIVTAKCGSSDPGDSITIKFNPINESGWQTYSPEWGDIPPECPEYPPDGKDSYELDDCGNELEVSIYTDAYEYRYNGNTISKCVWIYSPENLFYRKIATLEGTDKKIFTELRHDNIQSHTDASCLYDGCFLYYCSKFVIHNCETGATNTIWRRSLSSPPTEPWEGSTCPGH